MSSKPMMTADRATLQEERNNLIKWLTANPPISGAAHPDSLEHNVSHEDACARLKEVEALLAA